MRRFVRRAVREAFEAPQLIALNVLEIAVDAPFDSFALRFVANTAPLSVGGAIFSPMGFAFGAASASTTTTVESTSLTLDNAGRYWSRYVRGRKVAGMRFRLSWYLPGCCDTVDDLFVMFDGTAGDPSFGDGQVTFQLRAAAAAAGRNLPTRLYGPNCQWRLYGENCGADGNSAANRKQFVALSGGDEYTVVNPTQLTEPNDHWAPGYVLILSGEQAGEVRPVVKSGGGRITLAFPFAADPSGASCAVVRLCSKTKAACKTFARLPGYGGFAETPFVPSVDDGSVIVSSGGGGKK